MTLDNLKDTISKAHTLSDVQLQFELDAIESIMDFNTTRLSMLEWNYLRATKLLINEILENRV